MRSLSYLLRLISIQMLFIFVGAKLLRNPTTARSLLFPSLPHHFQLHLGKDLARSYSLGATEGHYTADGATRKKALLRSRKQRAPPKKAPPAPSVKSNLTATTADQPAVDDSKSILNELEISFAAAVKKATKESAARRVLKLVDAQNKEQALTANMILIALKALHRLNRSDLDLQLVDFWNKTTDVGNYSHEVIDTAAAVVRIYCRNQQMEAAQCIADTMGVTLKRLNDTGDEASSLESERSGISAAHGNATAILLPELALGYAMADQPTLCLSALKSMQQLELRIDTERSRKIFKQFLQTAKMGAIRRSMRLMLDLGGLEGSDALQLIAGTFLREVDFVTGAVSLKTLPPPDAPEVAFIGRSNVGKSSLINMICNRKGLAFTSKTPGKTSEFNYFDARGMVGIDKEPHRFYLVDLPGVGYAKAPKELRQRWTSLLRSYAQERESLKVIFHLVDSRHGLMNADKECLDLLPDLPNRLQYVILLTKVDKQKNARKLSVTTMGFIDRIYREVALRSERVVPIILTSSDSKIGGAEVLSLIFDAVDRYGRTSS